MGDLHEHFIGLEICRLGLGDIVTELEDLRRWTPGRECPRSHCACVDTCKKKACGFQFLEPVNLSLSSGTRFQYVMHGLRLCVAMSGSREVNDWKSDSSAFRPYSEDVCRDLTAMRYVLQNTTAAARTETHVRDGLKEWWSHWNCRMLRTVSSHRDSTFQRKADINS